MSKVTEELDFMWEKRLLDYYNGLKLASCFETKGYTPHSDAMDTVRTVLKHLGLTVEGIEE